MKRPKGGPRPPFVEFPLGGGLYTEKDAFSVGAALGRPAKERRRSAFLAGGWHMGQPLHTENLPVRRLFTDHDVCCTTQAHLIL